MKPFHVPLPNLQIAFYGRLQEIRKTYLLEALLRTVADSEIHEIDSNLNRLVAAKSLRKVAGWGLALKRSLLFSTLSRLSRPGV
ncbi:MAG: XcyI family restriction endonuclease [Terriglobia bacterium]